MKKSHRLIGLFVAAWSVLSVVSCGGGPAATVSFFDENPAPADSEDADTEDEVVLPEYPDGPPSQEPEEDDGPVTPGKDFAVGGELADAGGGSGVVVSLEGTEEVHATRLDLVHIRWKVSAGDKLKAFYVHGPLHRKRRDRVTANPCGKIVGRFLAVNGDDQGNDFNEGSADAQAASGYLTGEACGNDADCHRLAESTVPVCRIDLKKNFTDKGALQGDFYTRFHQKEAKIVLVAETEDGKISYAERTWKAPRPVFGDLSVAIVQDLSRVRVRAENYAFAANRPRLHGCADEQVEEDVRQPDGQGTFQATCRLADKTTDLKVTLYGVGHGNFVTREYQVEIGDPSVTLHDLENYSFVPSENGWCLFRDCPWTVDLRAVLSPAEYRITDRKTGAVVDSGKASTGGKPVLMAWRPVEADWVEVAEGDIPAGEDSFTFRDVRRDHDHSVWKVKLQDEESGAVSIPYAMELKSEIVGTGLPPGYGGGEGAACMTSVAWSGKHVRKIGSAGNGVTIEQPKIDVYVEQGGEITILAEKSGRYTFWVIDAQGVKHEDYFSVDLLCGE